VKATGNSVRLANPLFNRNKLKLGVFFANVGGGDRPTPAEDRTRLSWPSVLEIARMAVRAGMEAFIPLATRSVRNRDSNFTKDSYEPWTWAAGIAQVTENLCVFTTAQVPIFPPVAAVKLTDSGPPLEWSIAINVVCGHAGRLWSDPDIFGFRTLLRAQRGGLLPQMCCSSRACRS
jgi:dimethylsulfone monooxygenase